jgi:hypothetical protein
MINLENKWSGMLRTFNANSLGNNPGGISGLDGHIIKRSNTEIAVKFD